MEEKLAAFQRLVTIMDDLREKCPWDRKQTFESLRNLTIEETYELADAILDKDIQGIKEEIGDLMLHMVFYAKIADEQTAFNIADALNAVCDKLIKRHPHIYGDVKADDEATVKRNWEKLKLAEGKKSVLQGVPKSLPALVKAYRMQEKTAQVGFEWENAAQVWEKVEEEIAEFKETLVIENNQAKREEEFGDILFSLINYARFQNIEPETALERVNQKFKKRFEYIEAHAPKRLEDMSLEEMDALWEEAKKSKKKESENRKIVEDIYQAYQQKEKPIEWFDALYTKIEEDNYDIIPWGKLAPHPMLPEFFAKHPSKYKNKKALVIGCGLGDDAVFLESQGLQVDAFDLSPTAIQHCKKRFPDTTVNYFQADLLAFNPRDKYDLIVEIYTLQALPRPIFKPAIQHIPSLLNKNGELLIICRGRDIETEASPVPPYPLSKKELDEFQKELKEISFEDYMDAETPPVRRFRVLYQK